MLVLEILIILCLILANGVLAFSEIAIVSSRKTKLQHLAEKGERNAGIALEIARNPNQFLSTIQIGITLVGILAGAFAGASIAEKIEVYLKLFPMLAPYGETLGVGVVVLGITYLSLVVGELVPKRLALQNPERTACLVAKPMRLLSSWTRPAVWILSLSTSLLLKILRVAPVSEAPISEEEIRAIIKQATQTGVVHISERELIERIFFFGDRRVSSLMTPRPEIDWLDLKDPPELIRKRILDSAHSRFPVGESRLNNFLGILTIRKILVQALESKDLDLRSALQPALFIPETMKALKVLEQFRNAKTSMALAVDEYGGITGILTLNDILKGLVGEIPDLPEEEAPIVDRGDGSFLIDGMASIFDIREILQSTDVFEETDAGYETLAGFILKTLGRIPSTGDHFETSGIRFEIVDMDGKRIDKVLVRRLKT